MTIKTERITILASPDFKAYLNSKAEEKGISVSEFIRQRCSDEHREKSEDELVLRALIDEVNTSTKRATRSLNRGLKAAEQTLNHLKKQQK